MKLHFSRLSVFLLLFTSCAPKITTSLSKTIPALDFKQDVKVIGIADEAPVGAIKIGQVRISDTGFSVNCGYNVVIEKAKIEARKAGGNILKITEHTYPNPMGSSCDQISANILKADSSVIANFNYKLKPDIDSTWDYALVHVYRMGSYGVLVGYDLHLGDSVICRVKANFKQTIKIKKDGLNSFWAKTESKEEVPVNIKLGKEYYVRCSIGIGILIGRPYIEIVNRELGRAQYSSIK